MKQKILYIIDNIFFGGGERVFGQMINGLDKEKYEIYVACLPGGIFEEKIRTSAKILPLDLKNRFNLVSLYRLKKIMKEKNIQIVHSQGGRADFFARIAARLARAPAVVSTVAMPVEGYDVNPIKKLIYVLLDRFSERFGHRFIVVSEALRQTLIQQHRVSPEKVVKIYNGIEIDEYQPSEERLRVKNLELRREFNLPDDVPVIGAMGRLVWQKGFEYLLKAVPGILREFPRAKFLLVGEGPLRSNLEKLAEKLKVKDNVIFTGFRTDIKEILTLIDLLAAPSLLEGLPMVILEALAMAKPVVATNIEGVNETVVNGVTGILVPPRDPRALAEAIVSLLKDRKKAQEMGQAGRKIVEEKFNLKDKVEQHERLYETIVVEKLGVC